MFNPKSTIYQTGWLDLVFANRNKSYGAYELRQHADERLLRALLITLFFVGVLVVYSVLNRGAVTTPPIISNPHLLDTTVVVLTPILKQVQPSAPAAPSVSTPSAKKSPGGSVPVVVSTPVIDDLPTPDISSPVDAPQSTDWLATNGPGSPGGTDPAGGDNATGTGGAENSTIYAPGSVERFPEFPGGMEAFGKFLRKNLRYPNRAQEAEVGGRVFVSFVVERDGKLTDIKIVKGIGFGCDEEAARVLAKSPAWKPGIQNNRPVRVLFTIPLIFQFSE